MPAVTLFKSHLTDEQVLAKNLGDIFESLISHAIDLKERYKKTHHAAPAEEADALLNRRIMLAQVVIPTLGKMFLTQSEINELATKNIQVLPGEMGFAILAVLDMKARGLTESDEAKTLAYVTRKFPNMDFIVGGVPKTPEEFARLVCGMAKNMARDMEPIAEIAKKTSHYLDPLTTGTINSSKSESPQMTTDQVDTLRRPTVVGSSGMVWLNFITRQLQKLKNVIFRVENSATYEDLRKKSSKLSV